MTKIDRLTEINVSESSGGVVPTRAVGPESSVARTQDDALALRHH